MLPVASAPYPPGLARACSGPAAPKGLAPAPMGPAPAALPDCLADCLWGEARSMRLPRLRVTVCAVSSPPPPPPPPQFRRRPPAPSLPESRRGVVCPPGGGSCALQEGGRVPSRRGVVCPPLEVSAVGPRARTVPCRKQSPARPDRDRRTAGIRRDLTEIHPPSLGRDSAHAVAPAGIMPLPRSSNGPRTQPGLPAIPRDMYASTSRSRPRPQ